MNKIKDLIKPPFYAQKNYIYVKIRDGHDNLFVKIQDLYGHLDLGDLLPINFITQALNEKWERDFGEPMRWKHDGIYTSCPKCLIGHNDKFYPDHYFNYCPYCAQRLLPPEENKESQH